MKAPGKFSVLAALFLAPLLLLPAWADDLKAAPSNVPALSLTDSPEPRGTGPTATVLPARKMADCLITIAKAGRLEDFSLRSGGLKDAALQAKKLGPSALDDLRWIIENGSPCVRIYALSLLKLLDRAEAANAAKALQEAMGDTNVEYISSGERCHYSVSDILVDQNSPSPLIQLLPPANYRTPAGK